MFGRYPRAQGAHLTSVGKRADVGAQSQVAEITRRYAEPYAFSGLLDWVQLATNTVLY